MAAYVITRVEISNAAQYEKYKALSPAAVAESGGKFIVRGGESVTLEGPEETQRIVVLEFPDMETARSFYDSEQYRRAREVRAGAAELQMVVVSGV